jgi:hypothetical protein
MDTYEPIKLNHMPKKGVARWSIQAGPNAYCHPRKPRAECPEGYDEVELKMSGWRYQRMDKRSIFYPLLKDYWNKADGINAYVPSHIICALIMTFGGIKEGTIPMLKFTPEGREWLCHWLMTSEHSPCLPAFIPGAS